ncbi:hypothetical protein PG989_015672 [Apiospora arundinis]
MDANLQLAGTLFKTLVLGSIFAYTFHPLVPAMVVSTVCRLPKVVHPRMCQPQDVSNFEIASLFKASAESARISTQFHDNICYNGTASKPIAMLNRFERHDEWSIPGRISEAYSSRSQIDELLRQEARRSQLYHKAMSSFGGLCLSLTHGRDIAMRQNRDLVRSLYGTTATEAHMFQRLNLITVRSDLVENMADAFLAPVSMTFDKWREFRAHLTIIREALRNLESVNTEILTIAKRAYSIISQDLNTEVDISSGSFQNLPTLLKRFWYSPGSEVELRDLLDSLKAVQWTALRGRRDILYIEMADLAPFHSALKKLEKKYGHLRDITKAQLVEDWAFREHDIFNAAARWRQHLVGRYTTRTWRWLWFASDREKTDHDISDFVQMIMEPVIHGCIFSVGVQLLPRYYYVIVVAAYAFVLGIAVVGAKIAEDVAPSLNLSLGRWILYGLVYLFSIIHGQFLDWVGA